MESIEGIWEWEDDELPDYIDEQNADVPTSYICKPVNDDASLTLEEGEICLSSGSLQPVCSFQFGANDLDAAVRNAKKTAGRRKFMGGKSKKNRKTKQGKSGNSKSQKTKPQKKDPKVRFVSRVCRFLKEPKFYLIEAAVERLGLEAVRDLVVEVQFIEENGGQTTLDGSRRRTPGGVLWNVLRSRCEEDYKFIMAAGKEFEKQQRKRKGEVDAMAIDEQPSTKRQRTTATGSFRAAAAQVKGTGVAVWPLRKKHMDFVQCKVDLDNSRTFTEAQCAWAEGVKQGKDIRMDINDNGMKKKPASLAERLRMPIEYDDLVDT